MVEFFRQAVFNSNVPDEVKDNVFIGLRECHLEETTECLNDGSFQRLISGVVDVGTRSYALKVHPMDLCVIECALAKNETA